MSIPNKEKDSTATTGSVQENSHTTLSTFGSSATGHTSGFGQSANTVFGNFSNQSNQQQTQGNGNSFGSTLGSQQSFGHNFFQYPGFLSLDSGFGRRPTTSAQQITNICFTGFGEPKTNYYFNTANSSSRKLTLIFENSDPTFERSLFGKPDTIVEIETRPTNNRLWTIGYDMSNNEFSFNVVRNERFNSAFVMKSRVPLKYLITVKQPNVSSSSFNINKKITLTFQSNNQSQYQTSSNSKPSETIVEVPINFNRTDPFRPASNDDFVFSVGPTNGNNAFEVQTSKNAVFKITFAEIKNNSFFGNRQTQTGSIYFDQGRQLNGFSYPSSNGNCFGSSTSNMSTNSTQPTLFGNSAGNAFGKASSSGMGSTQAFGFSAATASAPAVQNQSNANSGGSLFGQSSNSVGSTQAFGFSAPTVQHQSNANSVGSLFRRPSNFVGTAREFGFSASTAAVENQSNTKTEGSPASKTFSFGIGSPTSAFGSSATTASADKNQSVTKSGFSLFGQPSQTFGFSTAPTVAPTVQNQSTENTGTSLFQSNTNNSIVQFGNQNQQISNCHPFFEPPISISTANQSVMDGNTDSTSEYQPTLGSDTSFGEIVQTKTNCITAMQRYENNSLEELRYQEYLRNLRLSSPLFQEPQNNCFDFTQNQNPSFVGQQPPVHQQPFQNNTNEAFFEQLHKLIPYLNAGSFCKCYRSSSAAKNNSALIQNNQSTKTTSNFNDSLDNLFGNTQKPRHNENMSINEFYEDVFKYLEYIQKQYRHLETTLNNKTDQERSKSVASPEENKPTKSETNEQSHSKEKSPAAIPVFGSSSFPADVGKPLEITENNKTEETDPKNLASGTSPKMSLFGGSTSVSAPATENDKIKESPLSNLKIYCRKPSNKTEIKESPPKNLTAGNNAKTKPTLAGNIEVKKSLIADQLSNIEFSVREPPPKNFTFGSGAFKKVSIGSFLSVRKEKTNSKMLPPSFDFTPSNFDGFGKPIKKSNQQSVELNQTPKENAPKSKPNEQLLESKSPGIKRLGNFSQSPKENVDTKKTSPYEALKDLKIYPLEPVARKSCTFTKETTNTQEQSKKEDANKSSVLPPDFKIYPREPVARKSFTFTKETTNAQEQSQKGVTQQAGELHQSPKLCAPQLFGSTGLNFNFNSTTTGSIGSNFSFLVPQNTGSSSTSADDSTKMSPKLDKDCFTLKNSADDQQQDQLFTKNLSNVQMPIEFGKRTQLNVLKPATSGKCDIDKVIKEISRLSNNNNNKQTNDVQDGIVFPVLQTSNALNLLSKSPEAESQLKIQKLFDNQNDKQTNDEQDGFVFPVLKTSNALNLKKITDELAALEAEEKSTQDNRRYSGTKSESESDTSSYSLIDNEDDREEHPTGIKMTRFGYYTEPPLDELEELITPEGTCLVSNFTIGRKGYGSICFHNEIDVAGLNIDKLVHFRNKEIIIFPNANNPDPIMENESFKKCDVLVTLNQVWPLDKIKHEPITDPDALQIIDYEDKLRLACQKNNIHFVDYRPETGSWEFKMKGLTKKNINCWNEEDEIVVDEYNNERKKTKMY